MKDSVFLYCYSGGRFDPFRPVPEAIAIEDIAHGLAGKYRFGAQSACRYTVAEHSVSVSNRFDDPQTALWGLLHDAAEAWLFDAQRPIKSAILLVVPPDQPWRKSVITPLVEIEERILAAVAQRFGLPEGIPAAVHEADDRELAREIRELWPGSQPPLRLTDGIDAYPEPIDCWGTAWAEYAFLARFETLTERAGLR